MHALNRNALRVVSGALIGIAAGATAIFFFKLIQSGFSRLYGALVELPLWAFGCISLTLILIATRIASWLTLRWAPIAAGSGVSQMKLIYWRDQGVIPWKATVAKFVSCALGLAAGIGLGRRGPSVFICSGVASLVSEALKVPSGDRRHACAAGAAAGLAASFNTPLAAVTFFLEEVLEDLNSRRLGIVLLASVMGAAVLHITIGDHPVYPMNDLKTFPEKLILPAVAVALFSSFVGVAFMKSILWLRGLSSRWQKMPYWLYPMTGATLGWAIAFSIYCWSGTTGLFGTGDPELNRILSHQVASAAVWLLLVGKLLSVCLYYGSGGCGGIFGPLIFLGGASGYALGASLNELIDLGPDAPVAMAALGMSACFSCVVRAPITGILMLFEMTHSFALLPPLMITTLISQAIGKKFTSRNIYDSLLAQSGNDPVRFVPPRDFDQWHARPVAILANLKPVVLNSLDQENIRTQLDTYAYQCFPVVQDGLPTGVVRRPELVRALETGSKPALEKAHSVNPATSIREAQMKMLNSGSNFLLIVDSSKGRLLGVLTLHDILRAVMNRPSG